MSRVSRTSEENGLASEGLAAHQVRHDAQTGPCLFLPDNRRISGKSTSFGETKRRNMRML